MFDNCPDVRFQRSGQLHCVEDGDSLGVGIGLEVGPISRGGRRRGKLEHSGVDDGGTIEGKGAMGKVTVWRPMRERERAGQ